MIPIEPLDFERDADSLLNLWHEVGWLDADPKRKAVLEAQTRDGDARVARIDGEAECMAVGHAGTLRYLLRDLPLCHVAAVTTSHVARRRGLASRLTADVISRSAARGAVVAGLGMFDQGYYDKLGFGAGPYDHSVTFDPATLQISTPFRPPIRLTQRDYEAVHANRLARCRQHGAFGETPPTATLTEMLWRPKSFGLGYRDADGQLTHHIWLNNEGGAGQHGPYDVLWYAYRTPEELLELLALLKSLGDQIHAISMHEPAHVQLQDLVPMPLKHGRVAKEGAYHARTDAVAWWQVRMLDVAGCLAATTLNVARPVRFNLALSDPIGHYLADNAPWRGVAGAYVITLGPKSSATRQSDATLPTLTASVNAFTRLWLGVRPARGLAITDDLAGPPELLDAIDAALRLPVPAIDW